MRPGRFELSLILDGTHFIGDRQGIGPCIVRRIACKDVDPWGIFVFSRAGILALRLNRPVDDNGCISVAVDDSNRS